MIWRLSNRAEPLAVAIADRHYNRQKPGTPQFVSPGSCAVFLSLCNRALWVTSWPKAEYVKHAWAGAWVNSCFRNEGTGLSSEMITEAVAASLAFYGCPPRLGIVSFIDPSKVSGFFVRTPQGRELRWGYSYWQAGWKHCGWTKGGLYAMQLLPEDMPEPLAAIGQQAVLPVEEMKVV